MCALLVLHSIATYAHRLIFALYCIYCFCAMLICPDCLSFNIGGFWWLLVLVLCSCRVALPLVMLSRLKFSLVLRFWGAGRVLVWVRGFRALVGEI